MREDLGKETSDIRKELIIKLPTKGQTARSMAYQRKSRAKGASGMDKPGAGEEVDMPDSDKEADNDEMNFKFAQMVRQLDDLYEEQK